MANLDWKKLKTEYATTNKSYREIADKYGVSRTVVGRHGRDEEWSEARKKYRDKRDKKVIQKVASSAAEREARILTDVQKAAEQMGAVLHKVVEDEDQFFLHLITDWQGEGVSVTRCEKADKADTKAIRDFTGALKDLTAVLRDLYDLPTLRERQAYEIAAERLKLEQQKAKENSFDDENEDTGVVMLPEVMKEVPEE